VTSFMPLPPSCSSLSSSIFASFKKGVKRPVDDGEPPAGDER
jgi:hypothetical protein